MLQNYKHIEQQVLHDVTAPMLTKAQMVGVGLAVLGARAVSARIAACGYSIPTDRQHALLVNALVQKTQRLMASPDLEVDAASAEIKQFAAIIVLVVLGKPPRPFPLN